MMEQIPRHGVAASTGGPTTPGTATAEAPDHEVPSPGLTLPDFTNWNLPPLEALPTRTSLLLRLPQPGDYRWIQEASPASGDQT